MMASDTDNVWKYISEIALIRSKSWKDMIHNWPKKSNNNNSSNGQTSDEWMNNMKNELFSALICLYYYILHNAVWRKFLNKNRKFRVSFYRFCGCQTTWPTPGHFQPGSAILLPFIVLTDRLNYYHWKFLFETNKQSFENPFNCTAINCNLIRFPINLFILISTVISDRNNDSIFQLWRIAIQIDFDVIFFTSNACGFSFGIVEKWQLKSYISLRLTLFVWPSSPAVLFRYFWCRHP